MVYYKIAHFDQYCALIYYCSHFDFEIITINVRFKSSKIDTLKFKKYDPVHVKVQYLELELTTENMTRKSMISKISLFQ